ncbi:MAG: hypothetical protein HUJ26_01700 [Planctomycetaceae bacterium]|nr:hypothetical protein [Planctomycetaceae bacterium]
MMYSSSESIFIHKLPVLRRATLLLLIASLSGMSGCEQESIHTYTAPKAKPISMTPPMASQGGPVEPTRMLAAILRQPENTWFFKLTAPPDIGAQLREPFGTFVASTRFENGKPTWEIPDDWSELPGKPMRFTTYQVGPGGPELSISMLPSPADEVEGAVANINRWRGQLGLSDLETDQYLKALTGDEDGEILPEDEGEIVSITTPAGKAVLIDFVGEMSSGGGPPFANMGASRPQPPVTPPTASGDPTFSPPDHWKQGELSSMRRAAYVVGDGDNTAEITVIPLSGQSGSLLDNVNRWRGQIMLPSWTEAELSEQKINLIGSGFTADYVKLMGEEEAILGAIINRDGRNWFIKLKGPSSIAEEEMKHFEAFVKSIEF